MKDIQSILENLRRLRSEIHATCDDFKSALQEMERLLSEMDKNPESWTLDVGADV